MRYIMLDTNILIDMIIDRKNDVSGDFVELFINLLDYNEIQVVVPSIVVYETYKHIEEQLKSVWERIKAAIKSLEELYGINGYKVDGLEVKEYKKNAIAQLKELQTTFEEKKNVFPEEIKAVIQKIFEHKNCTIIEDEEFLRSLCLQRRIYKRAPFHHVKKESFADGLIAETLIHISDSIEFKEGDDLIFVTGNTSDFSNADKKDVLHEDIYSDFCKSNAELEFKYVTSLGVLIKKELRDEVQNAKLKEEFEKQLIEQEREEEALFYEDIEDLERESVGLSSLGDFEQRFLESFSESSFVTKLTDLFEEINTFYMRLEEITNFYSEEMTDYVHSISFEELTGFVVKWNELMDSFSEYHVEEDVSGVLEILEWLERKRDMTDFTDIDTGLPDSIEYGDRIVIYGPEKEKYELVMEELCLSCDSGETDSLSINLYYEGEKQVGGGIDITYGYVEFDDDGGVGDACDEDISYQTGEIIEELEDFVMQFEKMVDRETRIMEKIIEKFDL